MTDAMECGTTHPQGYIHLLLRHARASEMHTRLDANELLTGLDEFRSELRRAPSRVPVRLVCVYPPLILIVDLPCDVDEFGTQCAHPLDTIEQVLKALNMPQ